MLKVVSWIVLGFVAGALGKLFMPGKDPGGFLVTILIGIAGALLGGFVASNLLGWEQPHSGGIISAPSVIISTAGAILLLWLYRVFVFTKNKKKK